MPLTSANYVPGDAKTTVIEIVSYEHKNPEGTLKNPFYGQELSFSSTTELLLAIDGMLDLLNYPQAAMASRRFKSGPCQDRLGTPQEDGASARSVPAKCDFPAERKLARHADLGGTGKANFFQKRF